MDGSCRNGMGGGEARFERTLRVAGVGRCRNSMGGGRVHAEAGDAEITWKEATERGRRAR